MIFLNFSIAVVNFCFYLIFAKRIAFSISVCSRTGKVFVMVAIISL